MHDLPSACLRCSAPSRLFHTTVDQVVLLCSDKECAWPLDEADDIDAYCFPATDGRVIRHAAAARQQQLVQQQHQQQRVREACGAQSSAMLLSTSSQAMLPPPVHRGASSELDELQRISNMLLQPSPACSPAVHPGAPTLHQLPSVDSLPSSSLLAPSQHEMAMAAFELPPAFPDPVNPAEHAGSS